jgi:hypothetical protein
LTPEFSFIFNYDYGDDGAGADPQSLLEAPFERRCHVVWYEFCTKVTLDLSQFIDFW